MAHCAATLPDLTGGERAAPGALPAVCSPDAPAVAGTAPAAVALPAEVPATGATAGRAAAAGAGPVGRFPIRGGLLQRPRGWFDAVKGCVLRGGRGQTLALVGESGCGKTTTGKAIVQLLRGQALIAGQALLQGRNLFELQGAALREPAARCRSSSRTRSPA
jgi:peptide/nickel transport system ATP-binding protein